MDRPAWLDQLFDRYEQAPQFIGQEREEAETAAQEAGFGPPRIFNFDIEGVLAFTGDFRPNPDSIWR